MNRQALRKHAFDQVSELAQRDTEHHRSLPSNERVRFIPTAFTVMSVLTLGRRILAFLRTVAIPSEYLPVKFYVSVSFASTSLCYSKSRKQSLAIIGFDTV